MIKNGYGWCTGKSDVVELLNLVEQPVEDIEDLDDHRALVENEIKDRRSKHAEIIKQQQQSRMQLKLLVSYSNLVNGIANRRKLALDLSESVSYDRTKISTIIEIAKKFPKDINKSDVSKQKLANFLTLWKEGNFGGEDDETDTEGDLVIVE